MDVLAKQGKLFSSLYSTYCWHRIVSSSPQQVKTQFYILVKQDTDPNNPHHRHHHHHLAASVVSSWCRPCSLTDTDLCGFSCVSEDANCSLSPQQPAMVCWSWYCPAQRLTQAQPNSLQKWWYSAPTELERILVTRTGWLLLMGIKQQGREEKCYNQYSAK